jgi:hypothetical protein
MLARVSTRACARERELRQLLDRALASLPRALAKPLRPRGETCGLSFALLLSKRNSVSVSQLTDHAGSSPGGNP